MVTLWKMCNSIWETSLLRFRLGNRYLVYMYNVNFIWIYTTAKINTCLNLSLKVRANIVVFFCFWFELNPFSKLLECDCPILSKLNVYFEGIFTINHPFLPSVVVSWKYFSQYYSSVVTILLFELNVSICQKVSNVTDKLVLFIGVSLT